MKKLCWESLEQQNIEIEWNHVKEHQDEKKNQKKDKEGKVIPPKQAALMNIDCNCRVEDFYTHPDETQQSAAHINPIEPMQIYFKISDRTNVNIFQKQSNY